MPSPCPHPHSHEVHTDAGDQPPVICRSNCAPKFVEAQTAQSKPDEDYANENAEPELPFFQSGLFVDQGGLFSNQGGLFVDHGRDFIMASRYNLSVEINQLAPEFELPGLDGKKHRLNDYRGRIVIVNFWSCECPHSERTDRAILALFAQWRDKVVMLSIAANRSESIQSVAQAAKTRRLPIVLIDAQQVVADLFEAQTTPHVFVIDRGGILRYRGSVDDVTFRQRTPSRFFLDEAVEALLEERSPSLTETPAFGCAIVREI